jgi:hypothetical protein
MTKLRQKFFWCAWMWGLAVFSLRAQTDSTATVANPARPERIAVIDISNSDLNRKQSQGFAEALANICRAEPRFVVTSENVLAAYLKKRRRFSIFVSDSAQALCKNLALHYLIVSNFERAVSATPPAAHNLWQVTLRWLDGNTGQMTKIHAGEYGGDINAPDSFPLRELLASLLASPDIIMAVDDPSSDVPAVTLFQTNASAIDSASTTLPQLQTQPQRRRNWLWYVTGAALVSGGSAALILKNPANPSPAGKALLPEPPDPPK